VRFSPQFIRFGNKKPRPWPGFFALNAWIASLISSAENTRPEPAGTATVAAADVSAGNHYQTDLLS
jgi:hypothetical protein